MRKKLSNKIFAKRATHGAGAIPSLFDERDYNYRDRVACAAEYTPEKYITEYPDFVYDQGNSNMCVACSLSLLRFIQTYKQNGQQLTFDPLFIYAGRDILDEVVYKGEGMACRDALKVIHNYGDSLWNDEFSGYYSYTKAARIFNDHKEIMIPQASPYKIDSYYAVTNNYDIKMAIMNFGAVSAMFPIYKCLRNPEKKDGRYRIKFSLLDRAQKGEGYHQMTIVGWDGDNWVVQNSWGYEYGDRGKVLIPMSYPLMEAWTTMDFYDETKDKKHSS